MDVGVGVTLGSAVGEAVSVGGAGGVVVGVAVSMGRAVAIAVGVGGGVSVAPTSRMTNKASSPVATEKTLTETSGKADQGDSVGKKKGMVRLPSAAVVFATNRRFPEGAINSTNTSSPGRQPSPRTTISSPASTAS
jgi:hypothetical protein